MLEHQGLVVLRSEKLSKTSPGSPRRDGLGTATRPSAKLPQSVCKKTLNRTDQHRSQSAVKPRPLRRTTVRLGSRLHSLPTAMAGDASSRGHREGRRSPGGRRALARMTSLISDDLCDASASDAVL